MELDYLDGFRLSKAELKLSRDKVKKKKKSTTLSFLMSLSSVVKARGSL